MNEKINELYNKIEAQDKIINEQALEIAKLNLKINKALIKNQYIIDYGFDYDGFNKVESLKGLIDMLVDYAVQVREILGDKENE